MTDPAAPLPPRPRIQVVNLLPTALTVMALLLALSFFGQVKAPLLAITLAALLAAPLNPAVRFFGRRGLPRGPAAGLTVLLGLGGLLTLGWLAVPPLIAQAADLVRELPTDLTQLERRLERWTARYPQLDFVAQEDTLAALGQRAAGWASGAAGTLLSVTGTLLGGVITGLVTLIMLLFVLANPVPLVRGLLGALPASQRAPARQALAQILAQMGAWGRATLLIMLIMGAVMAGGLFVLGVENWLLFGVLSALGELVPNIGPVVAILPPILFTLADDPQKALYVALFSLVVQQIESYVLAPFLLGGAAKMHPLSVTVGVLLFGSVFGLVGAFLTVPFLIVIKAMYEAFWLVKLPPVPEEDARALVDGDLNGETDG